MFVLSEDKCVYKITRNSAKAALSSAIKGKLEPHYNADILRKVVEEIMQYVSFPDIMDLNDVYILHNGKFMKYVLNAGIIATEEQYEIGIFRPRYNGPEVKQISNILEYSLEQLLYKQKPYRNATIVQVNKKNYAVKSVNEDVKLVVKEGLKEIVSKKDSETIADAILQNKYFDCMLKARLKQNNEVVYYSLVSDGSCKKLDILDVGELYKTIMSFLPNLDIISKTARTTAVYIHSKLFYGIDWRGDEPMKLLEQKENGDLIFEVCVDGIRGFLNARTGSCRSELIRVNTIQIAYKDDHKPLKYDRYEIARCEAGDEVIRYSFAQKGIPIVTSANGRFHDWNKYGYGDNIEYLKCFEFLEESYREVSTHRDNGFDVNVSLKLI